MVGNIAKTLFTKIGLIELLLFFTKQQIRILMYHDVTKYSLTPEIFRNQLEYIRKHFKCYWASEIPGLLRETGAFALPPLVLTFDDGYRNIFKYVAPLLERHAIIGSDQKYGEIQSLFMNNLPHHTPLFNQYHALFVNTGKHFCRKKPLCNGCPLENETIV